jgi:UDP-4-amino-4-deoxy-L-arabinose-oxoglutarate aminotransferase
MTLTTQSVRLPFSRPFVSEAAIEAVGLVLRSGWITSGPKVIEFEKQFAAYCGAKHAIAVSSATAGLDIAVGILDLEPGDEVIVPSINWVSGPNMVELHGGTSVFCEVDPHSMQIDPRAAAACITPRTRAIMPVHFAGAPCDLAALRSLVKTRPDIVILEDAAHATGTLSCGTAVGQDSELAVFSFHPSKNMTTGEGGMVVTNSDAHADRLKLARFHGIRKDAWKHSGRSGRDLYQVLAPGRKYNLTDIQAVIGLFQLKEVDAFNARRHALALGYRERLNSSGILRPLALPAHSDDRHSWHIFVVLLEIERLKGGRAALVDHLEQQGIGTAIHYPAVHVQQYYAQRYPKLRLPVSESAGERLLSLPLFPQMQDSDLDRVVEALAKAERDLSV